ncbi:type I-E CRISPR-associated protein Cas5/CasD [Brachybacterium hainanense]|uniref:Type I-E CRISPR-associated protein Cas5/CasD n=1 Tax=Brachybacterium hainanense TaxID=1541174 RepID=A0ABV6R8A2_9MICO
MTASTLLLTLKGPMQTWGDASRFRERGTGPYPTKSGVVGMLAAADGRRRTDPIEDLAALTFAVRVDQPGSLMKDFQTAQQWQTGGDNYLVSRYYLADAVFMAAVESEDRGLLEGLAEAMRRPRFPLFLGRRSCPTNPDLVHGIVEGTAVDALREAPWKASAAHRRQRSTEVVLPIFRDATAEEERRGEGFPRQDVPLSFAQENRKYGWRTVVQDPEGAPMANPDGRRADPFFEEVISA